MPPQNTSDDLATPSNNRDNNVQKTQIELKPLTKTTETNKTENDIDKIKLNNSKQQTIATDEESEEEIAAVIVPPDGGWGWVVMVASFLCNTVVDGIVFSAGIFAEEIRLHFNVSKAYAALVSSLLAGFYLMAGPFVSALANRYGFRPVTIVGAVVASAAFGISSFATSVEFLFITYGILGGIGFCLIYIPSVITIGYYFEKWRALATGIALCGSGVGTFIFAPLSQIMIKTAGWRGGLGIQAGIILLCALFGAAYRPIKPIQVPLNESEDEKEKEKEIEKNVLPKRSSHLLTKPLPEGRFAYSMPNSAHNTYMGAAHKSHYPTAAEVFRGSTANLERRLSNASGGNLSVIQPHSVKVVEHKPVVGLTKELSTVGENEEDAESQNLLQQNDSTKPAIVAARRHTVSGRRPNDPNFRSSTSLRHDPDARPMYRDDVFFAGSLVRLPQYTSTTSLGYHMSVTRLPTKQDLMEQKEKTCKLCPEAIKRTLSTMLDTSLLKSPSFMLLASSGFLTMMGFFVPFSFVANRARDAGMNENTSLFIISAIGITNTIARITCGLLSSFKGINALHLNNIAITAGGIATIFSGYIITEVTQFTYAVVFGICIACFSALRSIIAVELMGLEKLTNAFGFLMLFQGIAATIGSPIAGVFYDQTGSYSASFWLAGSLITLSAILCYPLNYVKKWEQEREKRLNNTKMNVGNNA